MNGADFSEAIAGRFESAESLDLRSGERAVILSDFHMGNGSRSDDLIRNGPLLMDLLERQYLADGWHLVLNGDIEEMQRYSYQAIKAHWKRLYDIFDRFAWEGRLHKTIGNHDEDLVFERRYPYALHDVLRIETKVLPVIVYHGHQASRVYTKYNKVIRAVLRYLLKPVGIRNISSARSPAKRFHVERRAYEFSRRNGVVSVIGHTHRPLFESLGRFDYIKFEIERLCRDFPLAASGEERGIITAEVHALQTELGKLKRSERRRSMKESLYGDELPVPCLFNSGSAIGKKGINAIELDGEAISLVYWYTEGEGKKFVDRGYYPVGNLQGTPRRRAVLNQDRLDYVKARMDLLR